MQSNSTIKHYASKSEYLQKRGAATAKPAVSKAMNKLAAKNPGVEQAHKVDLSKELKGSNLKDSLKKDGKEIKKAGKHLLSDAVSTIAKALPSPISSKLPLVDLTLKDRIDSGKVSEIKELGPINKPGLFFISGLHLGSISDDDGGVQGLAKSVRGGEHYSWKDEEQIFQEILRRPDNQPIVLVGHSLGGDAAVNLANRLNTLKGGFRKVNLLVTLDSVGFNNDIIPRNVNKNLNFISDDDYFFNDGPNIARNMKDTNVVNFLRSEEHTDIDESDDVHFEIVTNIKEVINEQKKNNKFQRLTSLFESFAKQKAD